MLLKTARKKKKDKFPLKEQNKNNLTSQQTIETKKQQRGIFQVLKEKKKAPTLNFIFSIVDAAGVPHLIPSAQF